MGEFEHLKPPLDTPLMDGCPRVKSRVLRCTFLGKDCVSN